MISTRPTTFRRPTAVGASIAAVVLLFPAADAIAADGRAAPDRAAPGDSVELDSGARSPDVSPSGDVAFALLGDLWVMTAAAGRGESPSGAAPAAGRSELAVRVTSGESWDRQPAWGPEGRTLYFSSDRGGQVDLWRVERARNGSFGEPVRVTDTPGRDEREPAVAATAAVAFRSGAGRQSDLWLRLPDGTERRLTEGVGAERSPSFSPDGQRVVYAAARAAGRSLRVLDLAAGDAEPRVLLSGPYGRPAWSPDGELIAYTSLVAPGEVGVTDAAGSFRNRVASIRAEAAWTTDGGTLLAATLPRPAPRYNGDPDRLGIRAAGEVFPEAGELRRVALASRPDAEAAPVPFVARLPRGGYNRRVFRRVAGRIGELYYGPDGDPELRRRWEAHRREVREEALAAAGRDGLERAVHRLASERPPARQPASGRAAVSSAHPLATGAGLEVLREGGNVVDAAVAVSFALGVVEPDASGIGGYGQMLIHQEGMEEPVAIEFLTRVPQAATLDNGRLTDEDGDAIDHGPAAANVPGTVAGMEKAWRRYGSGELAWAALLEPAIELAEEGFVLGEVLPTTLRRREEELRMYRGSRELFFEDGEPLARGDTLRNPGLAWTLRRIAENGAEAFYEGEVAERIVEDLHGKGNAMTRLDLERYWAPEREPIRGTYRGHAVYGSAPATTGGAGLVAKLQLLDQFGSPGAYPEDAATLHAMIEAWKLAPETSGRIADPGLWPVNRIPFVSEDTARARWQCFRPERAISGVVELDGPDEGEGDGAGDPPPAECAPGLGVRTASVRAAGGLAADGSGPVGDTESTGRLPDETEGRPGTPTARHLPRLDGSREGTGTTGFAVADAEGNMVAVTQTLGTWGGSFYVTPGLGFLYNDKLGSYASDPGQYNARVPFARNVTSISPTLVFEGTGPNREPLLATGAGGNAWITSAVYQIVAGVVDRGLGPQEALEQPRFLVGEAPVADGEERLMVQYEDAVAPDVLRKLRAMGHLLQPVSLRGELRMGYAATVKVGGSGTVTAGGDPRRAGAGGAIP